MTKELLVMECININAWYNQIRVDKNKLNGLSVQTLWALRKNMKKINQIVENFNEFKNNLQSELEEEFFNDEKSEDVMLPDKNGEQAPAKKVKDEYFDEYQNKINELNKKLNDLAMTKESLEFSSIDMEKEMEKISEDCTLNMDDLDMLSIFEENKEKDA